MSKVCEEAIQEVEFVNPTVPGTPRGPVPTPHSCAFCEFIEKQSLFSKLLRVVRELARRTRGVPSVAVQHLREEQQSITREEQLGEEFQVKDKAPSSRKSTLAED